MELGIHVWNFDFGTGEAGAGASAPAGGGGLGHELARVGEVAEAAGVSWLSFMDHYFQMEAVAPADEPMLEGYTTLGYLAAHTSTVQLGLLVTGVSYRHPGLLAKIVATLDALSEGRATLGIGAAWYEREHRALGVPFPPTAERFERLEETLQICLQMWDPANNGPYQGRHYELAETLCVPSPVAQPHPPILIGGSGERKTLRLVAQYADACNLFTSTPEEVGRKLEVLRRHCDDVGRDEAAIHKTALYSGTTLQSGDVDGFVAEMSDYAKLGIGTVMVMPNPGRQVEWIADTCAAAAARLAELP